MAVFKVPASKAKTKAGQFTFSIPGVDGSFSIPLIKYLTLEQAGAAAVLDAGMVSLDSARAAFEALFGDAYEHVWALDQEQIEALMEAWREASGISVGESQASGD